VTIATERLARERDFHDRQARRRADDLRRRPEAYRVEAERYLEHESWIRPALARLGDVRGQTVLDLGCGHGMMAVVLAGQGAHVTALDLSADYLRETAERAHASSVELTLVQADANRLPFADGCFDRVWGNAILHHLDIEPSGAELRRILKPGGVAVLCEPWGENSLLRLARRHLPYAGKSRTVDEQPLDSRDLELLRRSFPALTAEGQQIVSMLPRALAVGRVRLLERCDDWLLSRWPGLRRFCRYIVLTLRR
jgi:ubiquinone/menaquinone biosynthesis C-methylase UbiE